MPSADPITSVPLHTSTLRVLQEFKTGAQNWDSFLLHLLEKEMDREDVEYARKLLVEHRQRMFKGVVRRRGRSRGS
jgi:hypothetical protein